MKNQLISLSLLLISAISMGANSGPHYSDSSILQIVRVLNRGEYDLGELANNKSKTTDVNKFAKKMMNEHSANLAILQSTSERRGIVYLESDKSRQMKMRTDAKKEQLKSLRGSLFDHAYIDTIVSLHKESLDQFNSELIPAANDREVRKMLIKMKQNVSKHYQHALNIQVKHSNSAK